MKIDGSCHCGKVTYEAEIDPAAVGICHCTDCQSLTGTAFRVTVPAAEKNFRITSGEPKIYVKTAESGALRAQAFCAGCGSPIYTTSVGDGPKVYGIRTGTARQRAQLAPKRQSWHRSALPWLPEMECIETTLEKQT
jgi:hypothetical protein